MVPGCPNASADGTEKAGGVRCACSESSAAQRLPSDRLGRNVVTVVADDRAGIGGNWTIDRANRHELSAALRRYSDTSSRKGASRARWLWLTASARFRASVIFRLAMRVLTATGRAENEGTVFAVDASTGTISVARIAFVQPLRADTVAGVVDWVTPRCVLIGGSCDPARSWRGTMRRSTADRQALRVRASDVRCRRYPGTGCPMRDPSIAVMVHRVGNLASPSLASGQVSRCLVDGCLQPRGIRDAQPFVGSRRDDQGVTGRPPCDRRSSPGR